MRADKNKELKIIFSFILFLKEDFKIKKNILLTGKNDFLT